MKIRFKRPHVHEGMQYGPGQVVDVPRPTAEKLIKDGHAEEHEPPAGTMPPPSGQTPPSGVPA